ncbi:MAG TPA: hypothetical protein VNS09_10510 [Solirubrobacter sp.]|nr:hypothetical protein [Solirubrobacter sp.]
MVASIASFALLAPTNASAATYPHVELGTVCGMPDRHTVKPRNYAANCASRLPAQGFKLTWRGWGRSQAVGKGKIGLSYSRSTKPFITGFAVPGKVIAYRPRYCNDGTRIYTRVRWVYRAPKRRPGGWKIDSLSRSHKYPYSVGFCNAVSEDAARATHKNAPPEFPTLTALQAEEFYAGQLTQRDRRLAEARYADAMREQQVCEQGLADGTASYWACPPTPVLAYPAPWTADKVACDDLTIYPESAYEQPEYEYRCESRAHDATQADVALGQDGLPHAEFDPASEAPDVRRDAMAARGRSS